MNTTGIYTSIVAKIFLCAIIVLVFFSQKIFFTQQLKKITVSWMFSVSINNSSVGKQVNAIWP